MWYFVYVIPGGDSDSKVEGAEKGGSKVDVWAKRGV